MNAWLTPNQPPEHRFYTRRLVIPAAFDWLSIFNGALVELTYPWNYEESGDLTPEQTAAIMSGIYEQYRENDNEPPEWETPDEADGTPSQPWYDDLADWIIQGFLAVTFTPLAALTYQATVPKLRVAIRTGNLGALFKVLINGVEVWTGDSYSPITDLIDQVFDMSAETEPYTVRIEHNGVDTGHGYTEGKLEVIRGEAVADMVATILRADPTGCGIQWSTDNGGTWETIDLATCITGLANDAIDQAIADGKLERPGGQPGGETPPALDECKTFHVRLRADEKWKSPFPVGGDWTIALSNIKGAWSDGTLAWYCPDGTRYILGACSEQLHSHETGDPSATYNHMQLIGSVGGEYFNPDGLYTVPTGSNITDLYLFANDGTLSDNQGELEFDVEICNYAQTWFHEFDFYSGDKHGWFEDYPGNTFFGNPWGFYAFYASQLFTMSIYLPDGSSASTLNYIDVYCPQFNNTNLYLSEQDTDCVFGPSMFATAGTYFNPANCLTDGNKLLISANNPSGIGVSRVKLGGYGDDPFAGL